MKEDIIVAKKMLDKGYSVVICYKGAVLTSNKELFSALTEFIDSKLDFSMFSLAANEILESHDKLVNDLKIKDVIAYKISDKAKNILDNYDINCNYLELTIEN